MFYLVLGLFCLVALWGIVMTLRMLRKRNVPGWVGIAHGVCGLATLGLLFVTIVLVEHSMIVDDAALVFVIAALMGITIFALNRDGPTPIPLAIFHGVAVVFAIALLVVGLVVTQTGHNATSPGAHKPSAATDLFAEPGYRSRQHELDH